MDRVPLQIAQGTVVSESTVNLNDGSAQSSPYTPTTAGSYYWVASYSGDDNYLASTTACGENGGTLIVNPAQTSVSTVSLPRIRCR